MATSSVQRTMELTDVLYVVFIRVLALFFIFFALQYWIRLIGIHEGANFQFDTMEVHWKIASAVLAVLLPVVSLGLWGLFSWGLVVWLGAVLFEIAMYGYFSELFGENRGLIIFHATSAAFIAVFLVFMKVIGNKS